MPTSVAGKLALLTYLTGFWCYLFLGAIAAWSRIPLMAWLSFVSVQAATQCFGLFSLRWNYLNLGYPPACSAGV
jgi:hypothetical protein